MKEKVRTAVIGYGFAARTFHCPVITAVPELELAMIVQRSGHSCLQAYPSVRAVQDVREAYEDPAIDLIVITTPSTAHYSFVKDALLAGKHVVVEKPFTATTEEADELIALAQSKGLVLSVFHNRRWDGDYLTLQEVVRRGLVGRITESEFRWDRFSPNADPSRWRDAGAEGSGTFYDLGVHLIDQALTLFGLPDSVQAEVRTQRERTLAPDYFDVSLGYPDGLKVSVKSTLLARDPAPRYRLYGTEGSFVKYGEDPQENLLKAGRLPGSPGWGEEPQEMWGSLVACRDGLQFTGRLKTIPGCYDAYYRNVAEAIHGVAELSVKPEQARMAIRVIELGMQSHAEQRRVPFTP